MLNQVQHDNTYWTAPFVDSSYFKLAVDNLENVTLDDEPDKIQEPNQVPAQEETKKCCNNLFVHNSLDNS